MTRDSLMLSDTAMVLLRRHQHLEEDIEVFQAKIRERTYDMEHMASFHADLMAEHQPIPYDLMAELWLLWSSPDLIPVRHLDWHFVLEGDLLAELEALFIPAPPPGAVRSRYVVMRRYPSIAAFIDRMLVAIAQIRPEEASA